jgi:hypothetical protein
MGHGVYHGTPVQHSLTLSKLMLAKFSLLHHFALLQLH